MDDVMEFDGQVNGVDLDNAEESLNQKDSEPTEKAEEEAIESDAKVEETVPELKAVPVLAEAKVSKESKDETDTKIEAKPIEDNEASKNTDDSSPVDKEDNSDVLTEEK
jgi:hypothetical protein